MHLREPGVAYVGEAAFDVLADGEWTRLFTGLIDRVEIDDGEGVVHLVGVNRALEEVKIGGLVVGDGNDAREIVHCLLRSAGWPAERMDLGWTPGPREPFIVATPVAGVDLTRPTTLLDVTLTRTNPVELDMPIDHDLVRAFNGSDAWAYTMAQADTVYDAEIEGLARLDTGLSAFRAFGVYSYPTMSGALRPFERDQTRAKVVAKDEVFVGSIVSRRRWLRSTRNFEISPDLKINEVVPEDALTASFALEDDEMLGRAVREWRAAADSLDDFQRVTHLWRSVECYAKRSAATTLFSKRDRKRASTAVLSAGLWSDEQRKRLQTVMSFLNDAPIVVRFRAALDRGRDQPSRRSTCSAPRNTSLAQRPRARSSTDISATPIPRRGDCRDGLRLGDSSRLTREPSSGHTG